MSKKKPRLFDTFSLALKNFEAEDGMLFSWKANRLSLSHALAMQLYKLISLQDANLSVDMCPGFSKSSKVISPEIIVHNRETGHKILAVVCRTDYLTEEEQKGLIAFAQNFKCELVTAIAFLPKKNHSLLYRVSDLSLEYYHFDRNTLTTELLKVSSIQKPKDRDQLTLGMVVNKLSK